MVYTLGDPQALRKSCDEQDLRKPRGKSGRSAMVYTLGDPQALRKSCDEQGLRKPARKAICKRNPPLAARHRAAPVIII